MTEKTLYGCLLNGDDIGKLASIIENGKTYWLDGFNRRVLLNSEADIKRVLDLLRKHSEMVRKAGGVSIADLPKKLPCQSIYNGREDHNYWEIFKAPTNVPFELLRRVFITQKADLLAIGHLVNPRILSLVVDADVNGQVRVTKDGGRAKTYTRKNIIGRGTTIWELLVLFARFNGDLQGKRGPELGALNKPANRNNLSEKLVETLGLEERPIIGGKNDAAMIFSSIKLAGGKKSRDALGGKKISYDDQATKLIKAYGDDMPVIR